MREVEEKEIILSELDAIGDVLVAIEKGDESLAYADTTSSMELIDDFLKGNEKYEALLPMRKEASRKIMRGSQEGIKKGIQEVREWISKVQGIF